MRKCYFGISLVIMAVFLLFSFGCSGGRNNPFDPVNINLSLNKVTTTILKGKSEILVPKIINGGGSNPEKEWSSSKPEVAAVDSDGLVTGVAQGSAIIYLTVPEINRTAVCYVKVTDSSIAVTDVSLDKVSANIIEGGMVQLSPTLNPINATDQNVEWSSSKPEVAAVDDGIVSGVSAGNAIISVTTTDGAKKAVCYVTVTADEVPVSEVNLDKTDITINTEGTVQLTPDINPINATDQDMLWSSSDEDVAVVSSSGNVYGVGEGTSVISSRTRNSRFVRKCTVRVTLVPVPAAGINLDLTIGVTNVNEIMRLIETIVPADTTCHNVVWKSDNPDVAIVSASGRVYGLSAGSVTITATTEDGLSTSSCNVTVDPTVYAGGYYSVTRFSPNIPGYWKNGKWTGLKPLDPRRDAAVTSLVVTMDAVYAGGICYNNDGVAIPGYWKNGKWIELPAVDSGKDSEITSIVVSGTVVYAAGSCLNTSDVWVPVYWENGTLSPLTPIDPDKEAWINDIALSGADIYTVGLSTNTSEVQVPCYWINNGSCNQQTPIDSGVHASIFSIAFSGTDVYMAGSCGSNITGTWVPGYWLNNVWNPLAPIDTTRDAYVNSIAASGSTVCAGGYCTNSSNVKVAGYWLNNTWMNLPLLDNGRDSELNSVIIHGSDIYAAGYSTNSSNVPVAGYWKNGIWTGLTPAGSIVSEIVVVDK